MNLPNLMSPIIRDKIGLSPHTSEQIMLSEICADGSCNATECCVRKFGIKKCLPNTFGYTGPVRCCGSITSQKGCCTTPDGRKFCN